MARCIIICVYMQQPDEFRAIQWQASLFPLPLISSIFIIRSAISWTWTYNFLHFFAAAKCIGNEIKSDFHVFLHFHFASMLVSPFLSLSLSVSISI